MQENIILETNRLYFRTHILADLDAYCVREADPDFRRYVGGRPRPREEAEARFMNDLNQSSDSQLRIWAMIYKIENKYIGRCGIYPHFNADNQPIPGEAAFGVYLDKAYWGLGLATEAGKAFISLGFTQHSLSRIVTAIDTRNDASVRMVEKLGFKLNWIEKGEPRSFYHYVLERGPV